MELLISVKCRLWGRELETGRLVASFLVRFHSSNAFVVYSSFSCTNFLAGNECCERLAYYGMGTNLVNYLEKRLNMGNVTASNTVTNWSGTCYITPLIGAFLADSYLGRYWTIASFSIIYVFVSCSLASVSKPWYLELYLSCIWPEFYESQYDFCLVYIWIEQVIHKFFSILPVKQPQDFIVAKNNLL